MAFVYILQSEVNHRFYIGSTANVESRLKDHNEGKSRYTSLSRPFRLVFQQEYSTEIEAKRIEYKLKRLKSRTIIEKIILDGIIKLRA